MHPIERLHETSRSLWSASEQACLKRLELCRQGDVEEVIGMLKAEQLEVVQPEEGRQNNDRSGAE